MNIRFIAAGAGSGKTTRLAAEMMKRLVEGRERGGAHPHAVLATTFTRRAATDLQRRIRQKLLAEGHTRIAMELSHAMIGTVNSVCGQILERFAFEAGLSPQIQVLDEDAAGQLFSRAVEEACGEDEIRRILELSDHLGQRDFQTYEHLWKEHVHAVVNQTRSNHIAAADLKEMAEVSIAGLFRHLPPVSDQNLDARFLAEIQEAVRVIGSSGDETKATRDYIELIEGCRRELAEKRMAWSDWVKVAKSKPGKKCASAAEPIRAVASQYGAHPRLREEIREYISLVFTLAGRAMDEYAKLKKAKGCVDFIDQETLVLELFRKEDVVETLRDNLDLLLVDEFQDTSPIQLELFVRLAEIARESIWVGDVKQSIYGFRGSDPELVEAVVRQLDRKDRQMEPLTTSYRSVPSLVQIVNQLFAPAFQRSFGLSADEAKRRVELKPDRKEPPNIPPVHFLDLENTNKKKDGTAKRLKNREYAATLARGVVKFFGGDFRIQEVEDPAPRKPRFGEVAILCRTHDMAADIAEALAAQGLPVALAKEGLCSTPEGRLALACLRRLGDSEDSLAAAEVVALSGDMPAEEWLVSRLQHVRASQGGKDDWGLKPPFEFAPLAALEKAHAQFARLSPAEALDLAIQAGDVHRTILRWGPTRFRSQQRINNLEAFRALAVKFEDYCSQSRRPATVSGFLIHLDELADAKSDTKAHDATVDAVQVLTYHGAKGLEWPVVVCAELDSEPKPRLWGASVVKRDPAQLFQMNAPLANRMVRFWINPFGQQKTDVPLLAAVEASAEGVEAERVAVAEELRLLYVGMTRARDALALPCDVAVGCAWLEILGAGWLKAGEEKLVLPDGGKVACATHKVMSVDSTPKVVTDKTFVWFAGGEPPTKKLPARVVPSGAESRVGASVGRKQTLGARLSLKGQPEMDVVGDALHAIIAVEFIEPGRADREALAARVLKGRNLESSLSAAETLACCDRLRQWLEREWSPKKILVEWPFQHVLPNGQRMSGWIDMLVETSSGWVIVDHKSYPGTETDWESKALSYSGQLALYRDVVAATGKKVASTWIHFTTGGVAIEVRLPE